jgi:hypothetical protein
MDDVYCSCSGKMRVSPIILIFLCLCFGISCTQTREIRNKPEIKFIKLTLSKKIDDTGVTARPIDASTIYSTGDKEIVALLQMENLSGKHDVRWEWYSPDGKLYYSTGNAVAKTSDQSFIREVTIWHRLSIAGEKAADLLGKWEAHVFLDDERMDIQYFHLMEPKYVIPLPERIKPEYQYNRWGLIVGVEKYFNLPEVIYAKKDALVVKDYFTRILGVPEGNIVTMLDDEATNEKLESYITKYFPPNIQKDSTLYVYFVGHGLPNGKGNDPYLMLYGGDSKAIAATGYSLQKFYKELGSLKNNMTYVFLDTCFSGYSSRKSEWLLPEMETKTLALKKVSLNSKKIISIHAAADAQQNKAYHVMQHGLFTYYLLRGIRGEADTNLDNVITIKEVYNFLYQNVLNGSKQMSTEQTPVILPALENIGDRVFGTPKMING